jgi:hypothetical protein
MAPEESVMNTAEIIAVTVTRLQGVYDLTRDDLRRMGDQALTELLHEAEHARNGGVGSERFAAEIVAVEAQVILGVRREAREKG